nr:MAG TPA: hypothetical protein [Caudoviricetes sp.]
MLGPRFCFGRTGAQLCLPVGGAVSLSVVLWAGSGARVWAVD